MCTSSRPLLLVLVLALGAGGCGSCAREPNDRTRAAPTLCPEDARPGFVLPPAPAAGPRARFEIRRMKGDIGDQPAQAECVTQDGRTSVVPHGTAASFAVPAATDALTEIRSGDERILAAIPEGEALELVTNPCSNRKLEGPWLDASEHSDAATPHAFCRMPQGWIRAAAPVAGCTSVGYAPSEVVFLVGDCAPQRAEAVTAACPAKSVEPVEVTSDCVMPGRAAYCSPVSVKGVRTTAELFLAYGDRFAVCLDASREVTRTIRLVDVMPPPASTAPTTDETLDQLRRHLIDATTRFEPCRSVRRSIEQLDAYLDTHPSSGEALQLLGEAMDLEREVCHSAIIVSRHAGTSAEAFAAARERGWPGPVSAPCSVQSRLAEARALERASDLTQAAETYRRGLYQACPAGLHWRGRDLNLHAQLRLGLARVSVAVGDALEARRQLRLLDYDRMEAVLGHKTSEEEALQARLGPAPRRDAVTPEPRDAILALDRAVAEEDEIMFARLLSSRLPERALLAGRHDEQLYCDKYVGLSPSWLRTCILHHLLPEAPRDIVCAARGQVACTVTGADSSDSRRVTLVSNGKLWTIDSSTRR